MPPSIEKSKQGNKNNGAMKDKSTLSKRPRGRPRKKPMEDNEAIATQSKRPRGRPRKNLIENSLDNLDCNDQYVQGLAVQLQKIHQKHMSWMGFLGMPKNILYKKKVVKHKNV